MIGLPSNDSQTARKNKSKAESLHEIVQVVSALQSHEQKRKLTDDFLALCPVQAKLKKRVILEEPLAVGLGQMIYLDRFDRARFDGITEWYNEPEIDQLAKTYFPILKQHFSSDKALTSDLATKLGDACAKSSFNK